MKRTELVPANEMPASVDPVLILSGTLSPKLINNQQNNVSYLKYDEENETSKSVII